MGVLGRGRGGVEWEEGGAGRCIRWWSCYCLVWEKRQQNAIQTLFCLNQPRPPETALSRDSNKMRARCVQ